MKSFYAHGKLLISGEYAVLDGARALAVPTKLGQKMTINVIENKHVHWRSMDFEGNCWLEVVIEIPKMRLVSADFYSEDEERHESLAEDLLDILLEVKKLNPNFLDGEIGFLVETHLEFPRDWGLGSSSSLIHNLAIWAKCDPYKLLEKTFGGSGYDLACAGATRPLIYSNKPKIEVEPAPFDPSFKSQLYFVHLNRKQNSRAGIARYKKNMLNNRDAFVSRISELTQLFTDCSELTKFEELIKEHEALVAEQIGLSMVQKALFPDYFGQTKSLGAWGGDFILATGNNDSVSYFKNKGYSTIIPFKDMLLV